MSGYHSFAEFYDALMAPQVDYRAMADRICSLIEAHGGSRSLMLDLACGGGALTLALMEKGSDVIGVDGSPEQLNIARDRLTEGGYFPLLLCQDMEELDLYGTVESVVCTLDSLNHLPKKQSFFRALARAALFLEPGGLFLFDMNTIYKHREVLAGQTFVYDCEPFYCVWQNEYHPEQQHRVDISLDLFYGEKNRYRREQEQFCELAYSQEEILAAMKEAKLTLLAAYDGYEDRPVSETTQRVLYVAKKDPA